jgi:NADH pyrophosphatase NudC (nudix superfamily)
MRTSKDEIQLDCLSELQAAKWFLLREKQRHLDDIENIDKDLARLTNVDLPERLIEILDHHFNIPTKKQQTLFEKYKLNDTK